MDELKDLEKRALSRIDSSSSIEELEALYKEYLAKKGEISLLFKDLKRYPQKERGERGKELNQVKETLEERVEERRRELRNKERKEREGEFDFTLPGERKNLGRDHPLTIIQNEAIEILERMGFSTVEGPEIESEWYNFDALNFPKDHPAREMQDTLFIKGKEKEKFLMRTHTSPVQVRFMEKNDPPFRIIVPGRVFRNEATDASHEINFYQLEGLMVDSDTSVANFKAIIEEFCQSFFNRKTKIRLRPSYFPFTEPSFEVDVSCSGCRGRGCSVCSKTGWLEVIGAGMVHPQVIENAKLNSKELQGFAFGMGLDRMAMIRYEIDDVRLFYSGDLRFLRQF